MKTGEAFAAVVGALIGGIAVLAGVSWLTMLAVGAAHSHDARVPALGFGAIAWLVVAVSLVVSFTAGSASKAGQ